MDGVCWNKVELPPRTQNEHVAKKALLNTIEVMKRTTHLKAVNGLCCWFLVVKKGVVEAR
jgi:hypothetical protein